MRPSRCWLGLLVAAFLLGSAAPAGADIYRWTDDQGRDHFTMDVHQIPAKYRGQARRRQALDEAKVDPGPAPINTMTTQDSSRVKRALRPHRRSPSYPASASASDGCASWMRSKAQKLERKVLDYEKKIELYEDQERRMVRLEDRMRAENNAERYEIYLEKAEDEYEAFQDQMRQRGVPPGCLR